MTMVLHEERHTLGCLQRAVAAHLYRMAFEMRYPNYCRTCGGSGFISYTENLAPHASGYWPCTMSEPCPDCVDDLRCPLCGRHALTEEDDYSSCQECGWQMDDANSPIYPGPNECYCFYHEYESKSVGGPELHDVQIWRRVNERRSIREVQR